MKNNYRKEKKEKDKRQHIMTVATLFICLVATLVYLRSRLWVVDLSYEYGALKKQHQILKRENARLRVEVGRLKSPKRIEHIAREKLGLKHREEISQNIPVILIEK